MKWIDFITRYSLAVILSVFNNGFYLIFSPWTLYLTFWILDLFYVVSLKGNEIIFDSISFTLIPACTASVAYLLLGLLILTTRSIRWITRLKMFIYGSMLLLFFNILRILILVFVYVNFGKNYFDALHIIFWEVVSTIVVILIWIGLIKWYRVKNIPVYSDFKFLLESVKK